MPKITNHAHPDVVTASEIADYVFCPESWRLNSLGTPSANPAEHRVGTRHLAYRTTTERVAGAAIVTGFWLSIAAVIALGSLWVMF